MRKFPSRFFSAKPRLVSLGKQRIAFGGSDLRFKLEKFGWLDQLIIRVTGTYDAAVAALVFKPLSPYNLFKAVKLTPVGRQKFVDGTIGTFGFRVFDLACPGWTPKGGTAVIRDVVGIDANNAGSSAQRDLFDTAVAAGKTARLWWTLGTRRSATDPRGRIPLHNDTEVLLYLTPNTKAELVSVAANFANDALDVEVIQVTYDDVPESDSIEQFSRNWTIMNEQFDQVAIIGNNDVIIPTVPGEDRIYLGWYHALALDDNGLATSGKINTLDLKADRTDIIEPATDAGLFYYKTRREFGYTMPDGVIYYDFDSFADTDGSGAAGEPDPEAVPTHQPSLGHWLNTKLMKTLRSRLHIPTGTALGAAPRIYTGLRYLMRVA